VIEVNYLKVDFMAKMVGKRKVRLIDDSLLVAIPPKVWRELHLQEGDSLEFWVNYRTQQVQVKKYEPKTKSAGKNDKG